ncbi:outer membrane protein assembly factor BamA, partial [Candidatus Babeliales bacterium]|nr:outer membrane protein assembly factor BamA [Candidatus Babeliales bacterium]
MLMLIVSALNLFAQDVLDSDVQDYPTLIDYEQRLQIHQDRRKIEKIIVQGNKLINIAAILNVLPVHVGDVFNVNQTATMIKNLYKLGYFSQVKIFVEPLDNDRLNLCVVVEEKTKLHEISFMGNKGISQKDLKDELKIDNITTLVPEEIRALSNKIKKFYRKKNYHHVQVTANTSYTEDGRIAVEFLIKEGKKSFLNRISFKGNKNYPSKKLKRVLISKEEWILSMIDHSGVYNPEMVEGDKYMIEEAYKNSGFVNAKVTNVDVQKDNQTNSYHLTYTIHEGDKYRIKAINVTGNELVSEQRIRQILPLYEGQLYSVENLRKAIENLKLLWGEYGYIFADIDPHLDVNDEDKTVTIGFESDLKNQYYLNRLTIRGNQKTRDKVIRRQIFLDEGELITNNKMEISKSCVGLL